MIITSWAVVSLAGGGFGKVEEVEVEDQEKEEKSRQGHRQERNLGLTIVMGGLMGKRKPNITDSFTEKNSDRMSLDVGASECSLRVL